MVTVFEIFSLIYSNNVYFNIYIVLYLHLALSLIILLLVHYFYAFFLLKQLHQLLRLKAQQNVEYEEKQINAEGEEAFLN